MSAEAEKRAREAALEYTSEYQAKIDDPTLSCLRAGYRRARQEIMEHFIHGHGAGFSAGREHERKMDNGCQAGCLVYTGGEIRHHKDCAHYPESFSKMYDDLKRAGEHERKRASALRSALFAILQEKRKHMCSSCYLSDEEEAEIRAYNDGMLFVQSRVSAALSAYEKDGEA